jgi:hypothetical protein
MEKQRGVLLCYIDAITSHIFHEDRIEKRIFHFLCYCHLDGNTFTGCEPPEEESLPVTEYSITDPAEGSIPDFRNLTIGVSTDGIIITIDFEIDSVIGNTGNFVYMSNTYHHMVDFDENSFELYLDDDQNGLFETLLYSGTAHQPESTRLQMTIPATQIPDITGKEVWGYSMTSTDRIPDSGYLNL